MIVPDAERRRPRAVRTLPSAPTEETETGVLTSLVTRIVIVATIVLGQLFALTVALDVKLLDRDGEAWALAVFSLVSFAVVMVLTQVDPPTRTRSLTGRAARRRDLYTPTPATPRSGSDEQSR